MCVCIECINLNIQELFLGELFQALISLAETKGLFGNPHGAGPGSPGATRTCSVACPSPPARPCPCKFPPQPGPRGTPESSVSAGPGSRGAVARARDLDPCTAGARTISLGLPPLFLPLTAVYISLPPPPFSLGRHCFFSGSVGAPLYSLPLFFIDFSSIHGVLILSLLP
jgi:hypothetical protein